MEGPPLRTRRVVFAVMLFLVAASLPLTYLVGLRAGGLVLALSAIVGGVCRAVLPDYLCLGLLVRTRTQDAVTLLLLGAAVAVITWIVPGS